MSANKQNDTDPKGTSLTLSVSAGVFVLFMLSVMHNLSEYVDKSVELKELQIKSLELDIKIKELELSSPMTLSKMPVASASKSNLPRQIKTNF